MPNYAEVKPMSARLSEVFGTTLANNKLGMTEDALSLLVGRYVRGDKKGLLKGSITWLKVTTGGWVSTGGHNEGFVVRPGVSFAYIIECSAGKVVYTHGIKEDTAREYGFEYHNDPTWYNNEYDAQFNKSRTFDVPTIEYVKSEPRLHIYDWLDIVLKDITDEDLVWSLKGKYLNGMTGRDVLVDELAPKWTKKLNLAVPQKMEELRLSINHFMLAKRKTFKVYNTKSAFDALMNIETV